MTKIINRLKEKLLTKLNLCSDGQSGDKHKFGGNEFQAKEPSIEVMELARRFQFEDENNEKTYENDTNSPNLRIDENSENSLHEKFENFILNNSDGEKLPSNSDIENYLSISEWKRKELMATARQKGLLIKKNTRNVLNIYYKA